MSAFATDSRVAGSGFVVVATMPTGLRQFARYQPFTPTTETLRGLSAARRRLTLGLIIRGRRSWRSDPNRRTRSWATDPLERDRQDRPVNRRSTAQNALVIGALGVVFGDLGTSPLYTSDRSERRRWTR